MKAILIYEGYTLYTNGVEYFCEIDKVWHNFSSAVVWKRYIDRLTKNGDI